MRRALEECQRLSWALRRCPRLWLAHPVEQDPVKGLQLYLTPSEGRRRRRARAAHWSALESEDQALSVARPQLRKFPARIAEPNRHPEINLTMSATTKQRPPRTQQPKLPRRNLLPRGRICSASCLTSSDTPARIALGMLCLVSTSLVGNVIPLATGVLTDILAGSARPFESSSQGHLLAGSWLSRMIPFYSAAQPSRARHLLPDPSCVRPVQVLFRL